MPPSTRSSVPVACPRAPRAQHEMRDRRDARQRLAAEAQRADRAEILRRCAILLVACRSSASRASSGSIPSPSSSTRISFLPPSSMVIGDPAGAGVERVLDQLLDDRRRPLDDLAGRDLVGELRRAAGGSRLSVSIQRRGWNIHSIDPADHAAPSGRRSTRTAPARRPGSVGSVHVHAEHARSARSAA